MTLDDWLKSHAYLRQVASVQARVEAALDAIELEQPRVPSWEEYAEEFGAGVPLLSSSTAAIDFEPAGKAANALVERLAADGLPGAIGEETRQLAAELRSEIRSPRRIVDWLLGDDAFAPSSPGLLRYLGWTAAAACFAPLVRAYTEWRNEERWMKPYCPTCGSAPAMARLVGVDPGRKRFLSCGACLTNWQFGRTRCPFCRVDAQRLAVVSVTGEGGLRIDYCELCKGYLKTLNALDGDAFLMADWTSLHIDLVAHDRGLKRRAASLYDLESCLPTSAKQPAES